MKKWLVGLVAAGLFAAGALADSVTYTVANKAVSVTAGTAPEGSEAAYSQTFTTSGQATAGNTLKLTLSGYEGASITGLTLSMHSNAGRGAGILSATCGDTVIASIPAASFSDESWYGNFSSSFVPITPTVTATTVGSDDVEILITATTNSLFIESYTIEYTTGPLEFSISLDPAEDFEVVQGEAATITAIPQYAQGEVEYVWGAEGVPGSADGNVFTIDSTEIGGPYTVTCDANDGTSDAVQQTVSFSIVPAPAVYDVEVVQSEGGTVSVEPASGVVDTEITVTADPDEGYRLVEILVGGVALAGNTFPLPEGGATVTATFEASLERTATYTIVGKTEVTESGDVPEGSSATYAQTANNVGQITSNNTSTLTLKGYTGATITGLTLSMKSNAKAGSGSLSVTCGDAVIASIADSKFSNANWHGAWSTSYVDVTPAVTPTVVDDDVVLVIAGSENSLYCQSVSVTYEIGSAMFSVALDPAAAFEVVEGAEATVTATAKNALGEVTYAWTVDGEAAETDGPELALPTGVQGEHEVVCVATDTGAEGVTAQASVKYTVTPAPQAYTVTIDSGIENGSVVVRDGETELVSGAEVLEGTELTAVAIPATRSYKVESLTVTGEDSGAIEVAEDGTFTMPGENVFVTATFVERSGDMFEKITSVDELEAGAYVITGAAADGKEYAMLNEANTSTSTDHIKRKETPEDVVNDSISGPEDSVIWTLEKDDAGWTIYNAEGGYVCYVPNMGNSANLEGEPSARSHWTIAATGDGLFETTNVGDSTRVLRYNQSNPRFACYDKPTSGKSLAFYKRSGIGTFSVALDPAEDFDVIQDEEASIAATPKNAVGEVTYAWTVDGLAAETDGPVLPLSTGVVGGPHEVVCVATDAGRDGETATASVSYTVVAAPALYTVSIAEGIENGEVALNLDGTPIETPIQLPEGIGITVVATPAAGFKLEAITVNGTPIEGDTFVLAGDSEVSATFVESFTKTATYTVESTSAVSVTGTVPEDSEAVYASTYGTKYQLVAGSSMTLTLKGYEGATITGLTLSMKSNKSSGAGSLRAECGDAVIGAIADAPFSGESWNGEYSQEYVDIEVPVMATVVDGDVVITLAASVKSLYCQSFTVEYEPGEPVFSVSLDDNGFELPLGDGTTVTATAENGEGEITYSWSSETPELNGSGPVLEIPGTLEEGEYAATVTATDSSDPQQTATADLTFTVVPPPALYWVSIAEGIENGSVLLNLDGTPVETTPIQLLEGTDVTVEASPNDGFTLEAILVNGLPIDGDTFTVAGDTEVSAVFAGVVDYATLPFLAEGTPFTGPWQNPSAAGVTVDGLGKDYDTAADGRGARFDDTGDWLQVKFEGTPDGLSYALKGQGTSEESVSTFDVWESATGGEETWSSVASHKSGENLFNGVKTNFTAELKADTRFVKFAYTEKATGNVALFDVYIANGGFSVGVDRNGFELEQGQTATVTAGAKNGVEPYGYVWHSETTPELGGNGPVLEIPGTLDPGPYSVTVTATDSSETPQTAEAEVRFTVVEPKPTCTVSIAGGIENGEVSISVDGEAVETPAVLAEGTVVTVVATPAAGFKTAEITLNGTPLEGDTFTLTEDTEVFAAFAERGDEFVKITDLDGLEEGEYVITGAAIDGEHAMLAELGEGKTVYVKQKDTPEEIEGGAIAGPEDSIVWTLAKVADGWTIHNDAVGYVGYLAGGNSAGAEEEASAKSTWTIAESDGLFQVLNVGNSSRSLYYNAGATRFACYTSSDSSIKPLAFYKKAGPAVFAVSVDDTAFELKQGEAAAVTATARNGAEPYSFVWSSETEVLNGVEGPELAIPGTLEPAVYTATVTATDSSAEPQTATAEVTFTVVAPLPVYTVTVADGIENGTVAVDKTEAEAGETVTVTATPDENYKLVAIQVNGEDIEGNTFEIGRNSVVSATFAEIVKYTIMIDDAIEHGTIAADKTEAEAGETVTLTATPDEGWKLDTYLLNGVEFEGNTFAMPEGEAQVSAVFVERTYVRYEPVASAADLVAGEEYLVVAHKDDAFTSALKNENNGSRIAVDEVTIAEDGSISTDNDAIVWQIQAGAEEGQYVLYNASGVYAAAVSDGNYAQVLADGEDPRAQWTIDLSEAPAAKIASVEYPARWLQRNSTPNNKFFAAYTGSQTTPALYKKAGPPAFSVAFDKEDGFTVPFGTADSITATAANGVEPCTYVWTGALEGEGATLAIPSDLATGDYTVTVTATDASETPQEATASISFTVAPVYSITVDPSIVGGIVVADKETAAEGELVTLTVTPDPDFVLVAIFVNGDEIAGTSFAMPAGDVTVSAGFAEVVDYATLPFIDKDTPYRGPWKNAEIPGLTSEGLDSDYGDGSAKFRNPGSWMQVKFRGTPGTLSFGIKGNSVNEEDVSTFVVRESADGETWTPVAVFTSDDNLTNSRQDVSCTLSEDSQYVQFLYQEKGDGNVGIYDVYIGEAGEAEATVTVTGETTLTLGGTFALELGLENYTGGEYTWAWSPETVGYVDADTATFWWTPTRTGATEVTFSAMDGDRTIASDTVMLTVVGLVFGGDDEGTAGSAVNFTVVAECVADPTVTFMGFLEKPEGSALTDEDVVLDFPNVTFTPDVAGEYGLAFSAGTEGVDYVEDAWIVTVEDPEVVFDGDNSGTVGRAVKFSVYASLPGGTVDFENFILAAPEGSSLTEADVTIDTATGEVSFTPDVPGDYEFGFAVVGGEELYIWTVTVGGGPGAKSGITDMQFEDGSILLAFDGEAATVVCTYDLENPDWQPVAGVEPVGDNAFRIPVDPQRKTCFIGLR